MWLIVELYFELLLIYATTVFVLDKYADLPVHVSVPTEKQGTGVMMPRTSFMTSIDTDTPMFAWRAQSSMKP